MSAIRLIDSRTAVAGAAIALLVAVTAMPAVTLADGHGPEQEKATEYRKVGQRGEGRYAGKSRGEACYKRGKRGSKKYKKLFAESWRKTLTEEQKMQLDRLKVAHVKARWPDKARAKALKMQLAALSVQDLPDSARIDETIKELLDVKRAMLMRRHQYITAKRAILTPEQRISFDMDVMKRAKHGKRGKKRH